MEDLQEKLDALKNKLEGKSKEQAQAEIKAFEEKYKEVLEGKFAGSDELTEMKAELEAKLKAVQDHADKLDIKMQKGGINKEAKSFEGEFKSLVSEKFNEIETIQKGQKSFTYEMKDMTLGTALTGDQPRVYSNDVVMVPSQMVNFVDLLPPAINIDGGTYTFPREDAGTNNIATQTEGSLKAQNEYAFTMVDVNTDFLAGFSVYSKKMANNLPFLQSFLPDALRRDYFKKENSQFYTTLSAAATASTVVDGNEIERLKDEIKTLESADYEVTGIAVNPSNWWDMQYTTTTGGGYDMPGVVTYQGGVLRINGIPIFKATWIPANKYLVGNWSRVKKVVTEGLSVEFSSEDSDNFRKNNVTARIESQIALAVEQPGSMIFGDFTATT